MFNSNANNLTDNLSTLTLSEIVANNFKAAAVFEKYNLDFCCRGNKQVSAACEEKGINANYVFNDLNEAFSSNQEPEGRYDQWQLDFLADYIVNNHHTYVKNMIPLMSAHLQKVASVHGARHPEVIEISRIFTVVYKDLKQHMFKEEQILFPYITQIARAAKNESKAELPYFGTVQNPIRAMEAEHQSAGDGLFEIKSLTNNYAPPADACNTFILSYKELKDFEEDLHKHVHLENNILFPRAIELEKNLFQSEGMHTKLSTL